MKIAYSEKARQDIRTVYNYIAFTLLSPDAARDISEGIMSFIKTLASLPERYPLYRDEPWHSQGVRFAPVRNYLIFYTVNTEDNLINIVRIMYGARDISRHLDEKAE